MKQWVTAVRAERITKRGNPLTKIWRPRVLVFAVVVAFCASSLTVLKGKVDNVAMFLVSLVVAYVGFLLVSIFSDVTERDEPESSSPLPPPCSMKPSVKDFAATYGWVADPEKQALEMLQRGENCDWYSIKHSDEQHEAFDCLEIYWRTNVECPEQNEFHYGRGPFELKAGSAFDGTSRARTTVTSRLLGSISCLRFWTRVSRQTDLWHAPRQPPRWGASTRRSKLGRREGTTASTASMGLMSRSGACVWTIRVASLGPMPRSLIRLSPTRWQRRRSR